MKCKIHSIAMTAMIAVAVLIIPVSTFGRTTYTGTEKLVGEEKGSDGGSMADVDQDGLIDLVIAAEEGDSVVWYKQVNPNSWTKYTIATGQTAPEDTDVADLDNDGDQDIVFVNDAGGVVIAVNSGTPTITPWNLHSIASGIGTINLRITDVDGDGYRDVIYADKDGDAYKWVENPDGNITGSWIPHTMISGLTIDRPYAVVLVDWDGDSDLDVLGSARDADEVLWLEHPTTPTDAWVKHTIGSADDPNHVAYGDVDNDGDNDVLAAAYVGGAVYWYRNDGGSFNRFTVAALTGAVGVALEDLDKDGQLEIIASQYLGSNTAMIKIYEPDEGVTNIWTGHTIINNMVSGDEIFTYDIDSDGTMEIFSTSNDRTFTPAGGRTFWVDLAIVDGTHTDSLVGYWKFDDGSGTIGIDSSGDAHNQTFINGPTWLANPTNGLEFANPYAVNFDGVNDFAQATGTALDNLANFTWTAWVKRTTNGSRDTIFGKGVNNGNKAKFLELQANNTIRGLVRTTGTLPLSVSTSTVTAEDGWIHLAMSYNDTGDRKVHLYRNGVEVSYSSQPAGGGAILDDNNTNLFLAASPSDHLPGQLDDVRVYNRVLSATEIADLATGQHTRSTWTGTSSVDWRTPGNWSTGAVPDDYTRTIIADATNDPVLSTSVETAGLTVNTAAVIDVSSQNFTVNDAGSVSNNGTLRLQGGETFAGFTNDVDSGTVEYSGTSTYPSLAAGNSYYHVIFNGPGGLWKHTSPLDIHGNLTVAAGTLQSNGQNISLAGNWSNIGAYGAGNNTVTFNGVDQTISGDTTFHNFSKTAVTPQTLTFSASSVQTIANTLTLTGAPGNVLTLRSSIPDTQWKIDPQNTRIPNYIDVRDSHNINIVPISCETNCIDSGDNTNWSFAAENIAGTVYGDDGGLSVLGNVTVRLAINGVDHETTAESDPATGAFSITDALLAPGDIVTLYLEDEISDAVTVTVKGASGLAGVHLYQDHLITRQDNNGALSNTNLAIAAVTGEDDIANIYSVSAGTLTVSPDKELLVPLSHTFAPGNDVTTPILDLRGTFINTTSTITISSLYEQSSGMFTGGNGTVDINGSMLLSGGILNAPSNPFTVAGDWLKTGGTFTAGESTVTLDAPSGIQMLNSGNAAFHNLAHSGCSLLQLITNPMIMNGSFVNSSGVYDANGLATTVMGQAIITGGTYTGLVAPQAFMGGLIISGAGPCEP